MSKPYKEVNPGDSILAVDWNTIQTDIRQHILTHAHTGTGESGTKIDITALAFGADMAVRKLSAAESLTVGSPSQPLLSVNPAAPNQEGSYQVNVAGTLRADQVRTSRLDGITSLAVGSLAVTGNVGIGTASPGAKLDIMQAARTGTHPPAVKGLYVTGDFGAASDGVEFRHSNATQGIGLGHNTIYAAGTSANQDLNLLPKGTGTVGIATSSALSFGSQTRQMVNLWGTGYGIGVQSSTHYFRTDKNFAWYKGGAHNDAELNAGSNGTIQMVIKDGNVGIGTTSPRGQLEVVGVNSTAGTGTLTSSGTTVTGAATAFTTQLRVGDQITASGQTRTVTALASTTALTVDTAFPQNITTATTFTFSRPGLLVPAGNVGINTTDPAAKLEVVGGRWDQHLRLTNTTPAGVGPGLFLNAINRDWAIIGTNASAGAGDEKLGFYDATGSAYRMVIDSSGNVGIGTTTPAAKLSFNNTDSSEMADGITWFNPTPTSYGIHRTAGAWTAPNYQQLRLGWQTGIILDPGTAYGKSYVDIQGNGLRVTAGNVGIGIPNPAQKLMVVGPHNAGKDTDSGLTSGGQLAIKGNAPQLDFIDTDGNDWAIHVNANKLYFIREPWNHTDLVLDGAGNVGIGTVSPGTKLEVNGAGKFTGTLHVAGNLAVPGGEETLRMLRGIVNSDGTVFAGSGFSARRTGVGLFDITFNTAFPTIPGASATQIFGRANPGNETATHTGGNTLDNAIIAHLSANMMRVKTGDGTGNVSDRVFSFIVIGPR